MQNKILKSFLLIGLLGTSNLTLGQNVKVLANEKITATISNVGLNRIANPPYQIIQVTGDDSKYRLKSDNDGANIYLIPTVKKGEHIELILKNNIGQSIDLNLEVVNTKGQSLIIDSKLSDANNHSRSELAQMMASMKNGQADKYYVRNVNKELSPLENLQVTQTHLYKWRNLVGGVFLITNNTKTVLSVNVESLQKRFINVQTYWLEQSYLNPKEKTRVFILQREY
jgi:hypothetical protein